MTRIEVTGEHVIDIDDLLNSTRTKCASPLIHKIPQHIKNKDRKSFEPDIISIGPYHYLSPLLQDMQKMKIGYLNYILELNQDKKLTNYIEAINGLEKQARSSYANEIKMNRSSFVKMLLMDGCVILANFCRIDGIQQNFNQNKDELLNGIEDEGLEENGQGGSTMFSEMLSYDTLLMENQIPFFVIEKIFELVMGGQGKTSILVESIVKYMEEVLRCYPKAINESNKPKQFHHVLHLCHMHFKPSNIEIQMHHNNGYKPGSFQHLLNLGSKLFKKNETILSNHHGWRRAKEYYEAGIQFKKKEFSNDKPHSLLDIGFCNGVLEIPFLHIDPHNGSLFRNLLAFENTCSEVGNYVTAYIVFWSQIVRTLGDVTLLIEKGIVVQQTNNDMEIPNFFKSLGDNIDFDFNGDYYLKSICYLMEEHFQIWRPRFKEWLGSIGSKMTNSGQKSKFELPITLSQTKVKLVVDPNYAVSL